MLFTLLHSPLFVHKWMDLQMSNNIFAPTMPSSPIVPASDSLISSYPEFNWFGEFVESSGAVGGPGTYVQCMVACMLIIPCVNL